MKIIVKIVISFVALTIACSSFIPNNFKDDIDNLKKDILKMFLGGTEGYYYNVDKTIKIKNNSYKLTTSTFDITIGAIYFPFCGVFDGISYTCVGTGSTIENKTNENIIYKFNKSYIKLVTSQEIFQVNQIFLKKSFDRRETISTKYLNISPQEKIEFGFGINLSSEKYKETLQQSDLIVNFGDIYLENGKKIPIKFRMRLEKDNTE